MSLLNSRNNYSTLDKIAVADPCWNSIKNLESKEEEKLNFRKTKLIRRIKRKCFFLFRFFFSFSTLQHSPYTRHLHYVYVSISIHISIGNSNKKKTQSLKKKKCDHTLFMIQAQFVDCPMCTAQHKHTVMQSILNFTMCSYVIETNA